MSESAMAVDGRWRGQHLESVREEEILREVNKVESKVRGELQNWDCQEFLQGKCLSQLGL